MAERRTERRWLLYTAVAITIATIVSDWPTQLLTSFWGDHPMLAGIVSGLVLLLFASAVIERWIEGREEKQWERVASTAQNELKGQLLRQYRLLRQLVDLERYDDRSTRPLSLENSSELRGIIDSLQDPLLESESITDRLAKLSVRRDWALLAHRAIGEHRSLGRNAISRWAPATITSDRLAETLSKVSEKIDATYEVQRPLTQFVFDGVPIKAWSAWAQRWQTLAEETLLLRSELLSSPASRSPE